MAKGPSSKKLSGLGEFGWLQKLLPSLYWPPSLRSRLHIGPGDDAGALGLSPGCVLVASTDAIVEGIHFERSWFRWEDLGYKALAVNLSDLAAMGGVKPLAALVTAAFPGDTPVDSVDKFYKGLENCAQRWKTGLLGGDTVGSKGPWFVSITVLGEANPKHLIRRSTARPGDLLLASGPLGLAAAGLEALQAGVPPHSTFQKAFCRPEPRFAAGAALAEGGFATSLMDCSDGLEASARILCEASRTGVELWLDQLPITPPLQQWARDHHKPAWRYALSGGEDYELLFTIRPEKRASVLRKFPHARIIGTIRPPSDGCYARLGAKTIPLEGYGFSHFR